MIKPSRPWERIDVIFDSSLRTTALKSELEGMSYVSIFKQNNIEYWWLKSCTDCNGKRTQVRTEWTQVQTYVLLPYTQPSCVFLPYKHHKKMDLRTLITESRLCVPILITPIDADFPLYIKNVKKSKSSKMDLRLFTYERQRCISSFPQTNFFTIKKWLEFCFKC